MVVIAQKPPPPSTPLARRLSGSSFLNSQNAHALGEPLPSGAGFKQMSQWLSVDTCKIVHEAHDLSRFAISIM